MAEKIATRAAYGEALVALAEEYPELVVLDADLSGSTMTKGFAKAHPDRFYNMGIAEANMTGVAAGLAACGKKPFTNTFAMFAAGRAWEQVRNSIAYPRLNVKVVGSHGGLSVGEDGATHQCIGLRHHAGHPQHDGGLPLRRPRDAAGGARPAGL